ncbi:winged helix-turn-helix transcriptional regulator [Nonomuraea sp. FMUSA5-5]|uniref:Winged helix-turn-helix transcriptional regulator n=1 Tax=Nonomuraea composti TaxID=2720023 RepID=A0ABX1BJ40_9ACTN|nr:winged helix-turn-helix domain-containing protein [Nonomuraea sp. FMUSA5-5]NJP97736.1 winged helix-turn-helix transcriptional regulator [Nonomuraea sp. FMUSA5-5]
MSSRDMPDGHPDVAALAALLADRSRAAFCLALLDGHAWTVTELARYADVAVSTATEHLNLLVAGGLLTEERRGRHRFLRLAGADTAELIENLAARSPRRPTPVRSLTDANRRRALAHARVCYDHLAGELAVAVADGMTASGLLTWQDDPRLTSRGLAWLVETGIAKETPPPGWHPHIRTCLDWTEQRLHLAGALGAALHSHMITAGWLAETGPSRIITLTEAGRAGLRDHFGLPAAVLAPAQQLEPHTFR